MAAESLKRFSPGVFNRLCVFNRTEERTDKSLFLKVALKATFVKSRQLLGKIGSLFLLGSS